MARSTIAKTLKEHGIKPAPDRPTAWRTFIRSHADLIAAADFFTTEVWTARGLVTHYTLFVIDIGAARHGLQHVGARVVVSHWLGPGRALGLIIRARR